MNIRSLFKWYDNKGNKYNMNQKQEFESKLDNYIYQSIFKKKCSKVILDNIDVYPYKEDINQLLDNLSNYLNNKEIYKEEILEKLIQMELDSKGYCIIFNKLTSKQRKQFLQLCITNMSNMRYDKLQLRNDEKRIIKNSINDILNYYSNLFALENLFQDDIKTLNVIHEYINLNDKKIINSMLDPLYTKKEERKEAQTYIKMIVDTLIKNENANYSDIKKLKSGGFSCVYEIKEKVIKLGSNGRITAIFPNNPYIVKPLLRKEFKLDGKEVFVEVTQKVDNDEKNITKEDLYNLYSKLRDLKIRWTDVHTRNVGILLKDNKIYWHNDLKPSDEALGLEHYRQAKELKAGECVILDADFMFDENDKKIKMAVNSFDREFEIRYQKELKLKNTR